MANETNGSPIEGGNKRTENGRAFMRSGAEGDNDSSQNGRPYMQLRDFESSENRKFRCGNTVFL